MAWAGRRCSGWFAKILFLHGLITRRRPRDCCEDVGQPADDALPPSSLGPAGTPLLSPRSPTSHHGYPYLDVH